MASVDDVSDTNGHDTHMTSNYNKTDHVKHSSTVGTRDTLTHDILQHLRCNGYSHAATALQAEMEHKTNTNTSMSDIDAERIHASSLQRMYDQFQTNAYNHNTAAARGNVAEQEMVMTAADLSLQSFGEYQQIFTHSNRCAINCISFSGNGAFVAFGGMDGSIRVFDVNKLHQCSEGFNSLIKKYDFHSYSDIHRPLIATLTSGLMPSSHPHSHPHPHRSVIHEIDFHPQSSTSTRHICSCSHGGGLLFHEFINNKGGVRSKPIDSVDECFNIRTAQYHPHCGQFVLCGGDACYVRLYDIEREQGYIAQRNDDDLDQHIAQVRWSATGHVFAACTDGGDIRLYDGRSMMVVNTLRRAHRGAPLTDIRFNKDGRFLLSAGDDDQARLWDMRMGAQCMTYGGGGEDYAQKGNKMSSNSRHMCACFTYNDEHIVTVSNTHSKNIYVYDSNTGHRIHRFKQHIGGGGGSDTSGGGSGSNSAVTALCTSPVEPAFMCSSSDHKYRFFATIKQIQTLDNDADTKRNVDAQ